MHPQPNTIIETDSETERASQLVQLVKNLSANAEDVRDTGLIPESGRSSGVGNGTSFQYPCLEYSMDRGTWWTAVHWVTRNHTRQSRNTLTMKGRRLRTSPHEGSICIVRAGRHTWSVSPRHALVQHLLALKVPRNHLGLLLKCRLSFSSAGAGSEIHISYKTRRCWCWGLGIAPWPVRNLKMDLRYHVTPPDPFYLLFPEPSSF